MSQPLSEYFALEAGEFLDQMDALLAGGDRPDPVRFFRLARGVRGSAQLAGAEAVARVAERLEDGARAIRDGALQWTPEVRERARRTAEDLRALVQRHGSWAAAEDERADRAAERWADVQGGRRGGAAGGGDALFDFVRREIAGVVAEMDRAIAELRGAPDGREPLRVVLRRMRPVRGVAGMEALAPVLEVLEGIEDASHELLGRTSDVTGAELELLAAGAAALRASASALEGGHAPGESAELTAFRDLRDRVEEASAAGEDAEVIPITRLFADGGGVHLVSSPMAPVPSESGEGMTPEVEAFLRMEGTGFLDRAEGLLAGQPARPRRFGRTAREVAELAASVRELAGTYGVAALATAAELAANRLRSATSPEEARDALRDLRYALPGAPQPPAVAAPAAPSVAETVEQVESSPSAGETPRADEEGVVPVEALFYAPDDALREALALRARIAPLAGGRGTPLGDALDELFGLVELGLAGRA
ncbi:MAG TPA: Hpt domain-containing protein [Longimicrobium sp.]|jgi:HPt (histidine-containing phosphotransfer) domain-containing protein|uniref:Hpt domain-containing protein n=1 Tax=Longimicrobium sp. TaxID=2029185 RepID=UPI002ED8E87C